MNDNRVQGKSKPGGKKNLSTEPCRSTNDCAESLAAILPAAFADINIDKSPSVY
jgi:hypothetical protein